jgi:hypothetical protein
VSRVSVAVTRRCCSVEVRHGLFPRGSCARQEDQPDSVALPSLPLSNLARPSHPPVLSS